jgi:hypothetical protein
MSTFPTLIQDSFGIPSQGNKTGARNKRDSTQEECQMIPICLKKMQIKTILTLYLNPVRMTILKNTNKSKCGQRWGEAGTLKHCWWEYKIVKLLWKPV